MANYVELARGYKLTYDKYGITAQRQFIESDTVISEGSSGVTIPVIGDLFHDPAGKLNHLFCIKIDQEYLASDSRKILYTCYYSNEAIDNSNMALKYIAPTSSDELPQDISYSGEYQLWQDSPKAPGYPNSKWVWDGTSTKIASAIPFRIRSYSKNLQRIIPSDKYTEYQKLVAQSIGKVNKAAWGEGGIASWLFVGARSEIFRDQRDESAWKFELSFSYRDPKGDNDGGWLYILDEKGDWRKPKKVGTTTYMYDSVDFDKLFK